MRAVLAFMLFPCLADAQRRPNILIIVGDDWGGPYAGPYRRLAAGPSPNDVIATPNMDRLAREGVVFRNAFVNAPSCTPSRGSMLSGRYFFNLGPGAILGGNWDPSIPVFPSLVRSAGYHVGLTGKGWSPGRPIDAPFRYEGRFFFGTGRTMNGFSIFVTKKLGEGWTPAAAKAHVLSDVQKSFEAFLAARKVGQPFLYFIGPTNTHRPWVKGSGQALWGIDPDSLTGRIPEFLPDVPAVREDLADYLGEVQALDAYLGVLLEELAMRGELEQTLVILTGDNGPDFLRGKVNLYDYGTAIPLIARWPGVAGGRVVTDFVSLTDLAPTVLHAAGVLLPPGLNGRSFVDVLTSPRSGQIDPARTFVLTGVERHNSAARELSLPYPSRAIRTARFLYIYNFKPERWPMGCPEVWDPDPTLRFHFRETQDSPTKAWVLDNGYNETLRLAFGKRPRSELYDLRRDPGQIRNVAYLPEYKQTTRVLRRRLMLELRKGGDPRVKGDGSSFDRPPFTDLIPVPCHSRYSLYPVAWR